MANFKKELEDIVREMSDEQLHQACEECGLGPDVAAVAMVFVQRELASRKLQ